MKKHQEATKIINDIICASLKVSTHQLFGLTFKHKIGNKELLLEAYTGTDVRETDNFDIFGYHRYLADIEYKEVAGRARGRIQLVKEVVKYRFSAIAKKELMCEHIVNILREIPSVRISKIGTNPQQIIKEFPTLLKNFNYSKCHLISIDYQTIQTLSAKECKQICI